jgi:hypothetical protein
MKFIQSGFRFKTRVGKGRGVVRLANVGPEEWRAWKVRRQRARQIRYGFCKPACRAAEVLAYCLGAIVACDVPGEGREVAPPGVVGEEVGC